MKCLSQMSGEENGKYSDIRDERKRCQATLTKEYSDVRQKCWFALAGLATALLVATGPIAGHKAWLALLFFLPMLLGAVPLGGVVFIAFTFKVGNVKREPRTEKCTRFESIVRAIEFLNAEIKSLEANQETWRRRWQLGKWGIVAGAAVSAIILVSSIIAKTC